MLFRSFFDLHGLIYRQEIRKPVRCFGNCEQLLHHDGKNILLISQDLELGGPALALLHTAEVLKHKGFHVRIASMTDGLLRDRLLEEGIPVVVDPNLQICTMAETEWIKNFDLIICNTINFHVFLTDRKDHTPVMWWLHDSAFFYQGIKKEALESVDMKHVTVCSVGPVPEKAIQAYLPGLEVRELLYAVHAPDMEKTENGHAGGLPVLPEESIRLADEVSQRKNAGGKICFVTIGYIESRKGQDILLRAVMMLPEKIRRQAVFYLVGQDTSLSAREIRKQADRVPEIVITGKTDRKGIHRILDAADVLVCPSREDPMPTVCAEAMMHGVPCLVSDAAGIAAYIDDQENGLIFESENAALLSGKISWCIKNNERLARMGRKAREIYDHTFSETVFEENLLNLVNECMIEGFKYKEDRRVCQ